MALKTWRWKKVTDLQKQIVEAFNVKKTINPTAEIRNRMDLIKRYLVNTNASSLVLGISGGQDSTLVGKLAQMAINELKKEGKPFTFIAATLPYGTQSDSDDVKSALAFIQPDRIIEVDIKDAVLSSVSSLNKSGVIISDFIKGNEKARERMKVQYSLAAHYNGLVLGTDHASEAVMGFFTKHGDGACDIAPISTLNKRQGKWLLKELGCPTHLYEKVPTADLEDDRPQKPDEEALGVTYDKIDRFLEGYEIDEESKKTIENAYKKTEHKRQLPVSF